MKEVFLQLSKLGVGEFKHLNGSLETHLINTYKLLKAWDIEETICLAGLYHAMYGTAGFEEQVCDLTRREQISTFISQPVEELVYLYCACDRESFYPRIGTVYQLNFVDRFTQTEYQISLGTLKALCTLIMANELEIASHDSDISQEFVVKWGDALRELFGRMEGLVNKTAVMTYKKILN